MFEVYSSADSIYAGDGIDFHARCGPPGHPPVAFTVDISRVGAPGFSQSGKGSATPSPLPGDFFESGCGWPVVYSLASPLNALRGAYVARFQTAEGTPKTVSFVIKTPPSRPVSRILVVFPTATAQAYNGWGGWSLYDFSQLGGSQFNPTITFNRPGDWSANDYGEFIRWLEKFAPAADYATSVDLHRDDTLLRRYQLVLSIGHDEYWSTAMRDHVEEFIASGGNACFFSGNTSWWQVRFEGADDRTLVCYKSAGLDPITSTAPSLVTDNWYLNPPGRPENTLTGVSYRNGGLTNTRPLPECSFVVHDAGHWVFAAADVGTGTFGGKVLAADPSFGESVPHLVCDQVVGYECDGATLQEVDGQIRPTGADGSPLDMKILATATLQDAKAAATLLNEDQQWAVSLMARANGNAGSAITVSLQPSPADPAEDELLVEAVGADTESFRYAATDIASLVALVNQTSSLISAILITSSKRLVEMSGKLAGFGSHPGFPVGTATMGIVERRGTLFTAGTTDWIGRLRPNAEWDAVAQITLNLLARLSVPAVATPGAPVAAVARYPTGKALDIWVTGNDGQVYTAFYNDDGVPWRGWFPVAGAVPGGLPGGAPITALARYPTGKALDIWVTGNDGQVYTAFYNDDLGSWRGWFPVVGPVPSGVEDGVPVTALTRYPTGRALDLLLVGNDGRVDTAFYDDETGSWHGWFPIP
jgi:hypothetical protein